MRATIMYRAGDVRVENVPDATIVKPTDAVIRATRACIKRSLALQRVGAHACRPTYGPRGDRCG
jgi:hypothetical protein